MLQTRILVVDDDLRLRDLLKRFLTNEGLAADTVPDANAMDRALQRARYDLMVLDWMMPGEDGLAVCKRLRAATNLIPIIMLTAKSGDEDKIAGLNNGADDFLAKPFNPQELVARIHAVLRRQAPLATPGAPAEAPEVVTFGSFELDLAKRTLKCAGAPLTMTTGEFALLKVFTQHPREPLSRDKLAELGKGRELDAFGRSVDVQVSRVRKLLQDDPQQPRHIQTVWGLGYVFVPD